MNFKLAYEAIEDVMDSSRDRDRKQFVVKQILISVLKSEDAESVNGLIRQLDLNMWDNGAHPLLATVDCPDPPRPVMSQQELREEVASYRVEPIPIVLED